MQTTTSTTTTRCPDQCWRWDCVLLKNISINCTDTATATTITTTTTTTTITTTNSIGENCQALRDELTRVKLGLGLGLGSGMLVTSSMAVGFYVYFARRTGQMSFSATGAI
ncbi:unnamed protein product [Rotaria sp. Silwood1]|nr:unnamed protein product [Rotaria sp. Silwood1]